MLSRRKIEQYAKDREAKRAAQRAALLVPSRSLHRGTYSGGVSGEAVPKSQPLRDQALRDMAEGRPCMFLIPAVCNVRQETTVLCHENQGKGTGTKQSDERAAWGCAACHEWYDRSGAPREAKRAAFMGAHSRQVLAYRVVATDPSEPERFRNAARRALERLNATPIGETV